VIVALGTPTNANLGAPASHTLMIVDDDLICYGAGAYQVCLDSPPTGAQVLPTSINTDAGSAQCDAPPAGWTTGGQPDACFINGSTITMSGATTVTGGRPLVIVAATTIAISSNLDGASHQANGARGAGSPSALCAAFVRAPGSGVGGGGGGAGGSFMTKGGDGGQGDVGGGNNQTGQAANADAAAPAYLRAGCSGQKGGDGGATGGSGGLGGGAIYLVAGTSITVSTGITINVSGAGGNAGPSSEGGGGGGGAGGMLALYAPTLTVTGAKLMSNGGSGGGGADGSTNGGNGIDPSIATPTVAPAGGAAASAGGSGGVGFAGATQAGSALGNGNAAGGGGGAGGYIQSNVALTGATVSAGSIVVQ
jgi:hypothetical protein